MWAIQRFYKIERFCYLKKIPLVPEMIKDLIRAKYHCVIPYTAEIGENTKIAYGGIGVIMHPETKIGKNCIIGTQVTFGANKRMDCGPTIGDNCFISTGAKILGPITIGRGSVIGANSVVTRDMPEKSLIAGIPAKVVKSNIKVSDYSPYMKDVDDAD